jgi:cystathionine beta-lyase
MMSATSKVFNLAGLHSGNVIIPDAALRERFTARLAALGIATNSAGIIAATAAYSPEGAEWADAQNAYIGDNFSLFAKGVRAIPGLKVMELEATYLAWVDFRGTGMDQAEIERRVEAVAGIAANRGPTFGTGGEGHMRFNLATQRVRVEEAVARLTRAFADLQ